MYELEAHQEGTASDRYVPRILVVDDEPSICAIVRTILREEPFVVETATHPLDALQRLREAPFDLLLTDISMPDLDGLALAERARAEHPLLGIVIITAYGSFDNIARAVRTGIADFITKPFEIRELRDTVVRALKRQELQRNNMRLQTLVNIFDYSQAISSTLDLGELGRVVADIVLHGTSATSVAVWAGTSARLLQLLPGAVLPEAINEQAGALAQKVFVTGRQATAVVDTDAGQKLLALPLQALDERIGVLVAAYRPGSETPIAEFLGIIANHVALALRNAWQYKSLSELDRLKSEFIGIASHELRTPLSLVLGYSSLLRNRLTGRERDSLQQIINGAIRIGDIVDDLVNLRRSDLQQQELKPTRVDIWTLLGKVVAELTPLAQQRQVVLELKCPDEPTWVTVDEEKISLALAHLVDNATKFTPHGGSVQVAGVAPGPAEPVVLIEVQDTGLGITPSDVSRVFDRFYQVAPSATREQTGLGIGLAIAKMFVELHGGHVQVQSEPGQGSVFQVRLPVIPAER